MESPRRFFHSNTPNKYAFVAGRDSAEELDRLFGYLKQLGQEEDKLLIGATMGRRSGYGDAGCSSMKTEKCASLHAWSDNYSRDYSLRI